jgi:hypothetical protein
MVASASAMLRRIATPAATAIRCTMTHMPRRGMVRRGVGVGVGVCGRERAGGGGGWACGPCVCASHDSEACDATTHTGY